MSEARREIARQMRALREQQIAEKAQRKRKKEAEADAYTGDTTVSEDATMTDVKQGRKLKHTVRSREADFKKENGEKERDDAGDKDEDGGRQRDHQAGEGTEGTFHIQAYNDNVGQGGAGEDGEEGSKEEQEDTLAPRRSTRIEARRRR
ncbi:hypothetical protein MMC21_005261 [Puttea exsequens]|nr:hypothetical protein [Puttea exsequens]